MPDLYGVINAPTIEIARQQTAGNNHFESLRADSEGNIPPVEPPTEQPGPFFAEPDGLRAGWVGARLGSFTPGEAMRVKTDDGSKEMIQTPGFSPPPPASLREFSEMFEVQHPGIHASTTNTEFSVPKAHEVPIDTEAVMMAAREVVSDAQIERVSIAAGRFIPTDASGGLSETNTAVAQAVAAIPGLVTAAAKVNVSPQSAVETLITAMSGIKDAVGIPSTAPAAHLLEVFRAAAEHRQPLDEEEMQHLRELLPETATTDRGYDGTLDMLRIAKQAVRSGMSAAEALDLVRDFRNSEQQTSRPTTERHTAPTATMVDALEALNALQVDPQALRVVLKGFLQIPSADSEHIYMQLIESVAHSVGWYRMSPYELIRDVAERLQAGEMPEIALRHTLASAEFRAHKNPDLTQNYSQPENYFIPKAGTPRLEHAIAPYRTARSLNQVANDLHQLAATNPSSGEPIRAGIWAFRYEGPGMGTAYNLSGLPDKSRFDAATIPYLFDLSTISSTPGIFYLHPDTNTTELGRFASLFPTYRDLQHVVAFGQSHVMQGPATIYTFIATSHGLTQFEHPQGTQFTPELMVEINSIIRDFVLRLGSNAEVNEHTTLRDLARSLGPSSFADRCVRTVNQSLPAGFGMYFFPHGTDLETVLVDTKK